MLEFVTTSQKWHFLRLFGRLCFSFALFAAFSNAEFGWHSCLLMIGVKRRKQPPQVLTSLWIELLFARVGPVGTVRRSTPRVARACGCVQSNFSLITDLWRFFSEISYWYWLQSGVTFVRYFQGISIHPYFVPSIVMHVFLSQAVESFAVHKAGDQCVFELSICIVNCWCDCRLLGSKMMSSQAACRVEF
jgi:hypothetical protein